MVKFPSPRRPSRWALFVWRAGHLAGLRSCGSARNGGRRHFDANPAFPRRRSDAPWRVPGLGKYGQTMQRVCHPRCAVPKGAGPCLLVYIQRTSFARTSNLYTKSNAAVALGRVVFATGRRYELSAIAAHQGNAEAGHYFLYRRRGSAGESWTLYNDATVSVCGQVPSLALTSARYVLYTGNATLPTSGRRRRTRAQSGPAINRHVPPLRSARCG